MSDDFTRDIATGIAGILDAETIATYRETGAYEPSETGITFKKVPQSGRIVAISTYRVSDGVHREDVVGIQLHCRGTTDPFDVDDLADAAFNALHGRTNVNLGAFTASLIERRSHSSLGQDGNGCWETSSNYYAWVDRPTAHRDA